MATGVGGTLFHANYKINTDFRGYNLKFHIANSNQTAAKVVGNLIASYLKVIMPTDAEIMFATVSNDNHKRDSAFLRDSIGAGTYIDGGVDPPPSVYDFPSVAVKLRLEHDDGSSVTRKINPIPDAIVTDERFLEAIADVVAMPGTIAAAGTGADWYANFNLLMQVIVKWTQHVQAGHSPGGDYTYFPWNAAYVLSTTVKKGGRVFRP
jgi:hypothetical protein